MLALPPKYIQAIEAVLHIAHMSGATPISSKAIAENLNVPTRYLEQIMQRLVRSGILRGVRGPRGGYLLARERRRITVAQIIEALSEDEESTPAESPAAQAVMPVIRQAMAESMKYLQGITLAELSAQASMLKPKGQKSGRMDFTI